MRLLFTTQPGYGHFYPMVGLAQAAQRAGHEVAFATSASFCPAVASAGFTDFPAGLDWLEAEIEREFPDVDSSRVMPPRRQIGWWLNRVWGGRAPRLMARDLLEIARAWRPDVVVHDQWELGGALASELLELPYAMHSQGLYMPARLWRDLAGPALEELRCDLGLPHDPALSFLHRHLYLDDVPSSLQTPYELPAAHRFRPVARAETGGDGLPALLGRLDRRPTIYASMGTVFDAPPGLFRSVVDGLGDEPLNVILVVGAARDPGSLGPLPENIHIERFLPQVSVLRHCEAVITHAGYNTVLEALRQGLPMVSVPLCVDQPLNAERCVELGAAIRLRSEEATPSAVRAAIRRLVEDPHYRCSAQRVRSEIEAMPAIETAVRRLQSLAGLGQHPPPEASDPERRQRTGEAGKRHVGGREGHVRHARDERRA